MNYEAEPMQQPVRKAVGRPPTPSQRLVRLEQMLAFVRKFAHEALARTGPDYFTVRKAVGRPRAARR